MKSTRKKASDTLKRAQKIYNAQKDDYRKIFKAEVRKGGDPKKAAKKAGEIYRDRYGKTATIRWKNALRKAK